MTKKPKNNRRTAPSEDRTHDLQIMRLTRCLLRYRGGLCSTPPPGFTRRQPERKNPDILVLFVKKSETHTNSCVRTNSLVDLWKRGRQQNAFCRCVGGGRRLEFVLSRQRAGHQKRFASFCLSYRAAVQCGANKTADYKNFGKGPWLLKLFDIQCRSA